MQIGNLKEIITNNLNWVQFYFSNLFRNKYQNYQFETTGGYLTPNMLYTCIFKEIPQRLIIEGVNKDTFLKEIRETYKIVDQFEFISKTYKEGIMSTNTACFVVEKDVMIYARNHFSDSIELLYNSKKRSELIIENIKTTADKHQVTKEKQNKIRLLVSGANGIYFAPIQMPNETVSLNYYNDNFDDFNTSICDKLTNEQKGLFLLFGNPGTGKSSYIKHLINEVDKQFLFIPAQLSHSLGSPEFISILLEHSGRSVIIIEDAENLLISRNQIRSDSLSNLLNLTDGILADTIRIQFICTFNSSITKLDDALLRKGRLSMSYNFEPLTLEKAKQIALDLGKEANKINAPITVSDLIHLENNNNSIVNSLANKIGFN